MPCLAACEVVRKVWEHNRCLLFGEDWEYAIIATLEDGAQVCTGDRIAYEPYGVNFGWYHHRIEVPGVAH